MEFWATGRVVVYETDGGSGKSVRPVFEAQIWSIGSGREDGRERSNVRKTEDSSGLNCRLMNCRDVIRKRVTIRVAEYVLQFGYSG